MDTSIIKRTDNYPLTQPQASHYCQKEIGAIEFLDQVSDLLKWGSRQNYSADYITEKIHALVEQNPNLVSEMKFPSDFLDIKKNVVNQWKMKNEADITVNSTPVLKSSADRKKSILENTSAIFEVADNPNAVGAKPIIELESQSQVAQYDALIVKEAKAQNVDPDLVRAIMYMETTHGYYDKLVAPFDVNASILPMNIRAENWKELGTARRDLKDPEKNIRAGVLLIKRISERIKDPTVEKIATVYNVLEKEHVSDYGARVGKIYREKLWQ